MKRIKLLLALLIWATCLGSSDKDTKTYENQKDGYRFSYPATWTLETDESSDYASLFSPGAKRSEPNSFDLVWGIKMEFVHEDDPQAFEQELKAEGFKPCGVTNDGQRITYCAEDDGLTLVATSLRCDKTIITARGYIPEKNKKGEYLKQYLKIIGSFSFTAK